MRLNIHLNIKVDVWRMKPKQMSKQNTLVLTTEPEADHFKQPLEKNNYT